MEPSTSSATKKAAKAVTKKQTVPRGMPKSGRIWKTPSTKFSRIKKSIRGKTFTKKEELRNDIKAIKELSATIKENKRLEKEQKKERRLENERRRAENQRKNEVVQIIKNPAKLKRARKKQLRMIEKRDLATVKTV